MDCLQCATENPEGAKFCLNCGTALIMVCPRCNAVLPLQARFCIECGAQVGAPSEAALPPEQDSYETNLRRLVPEEYAERLLARQGQMGHERRTVTLLFCDVEGSTALAEGLDPEGVLEIMDGAFDYSSSRSTATRARWPS
jgi:ribosomal protein L40E